MNWSWILPCYILNHLLPWATASYMDILVVKEADGVVLLKLKMMLFAVNIVISATVIICSRRVGYSLASKQLQLDTNRASSSETFWCSRRVGYSLASKQLQLDTNRASSSETFWCSRRVWIQPCQQTASVRY